MPLKIVPPRKDKASKNYYVRGTYLGQYVDVSAGTSSRKIAQQELKRLELEIERRRYAKAGEPTFEDAVKTYLEAGGDPRFLEPLVLHFDKTPLSDLNQHAIDKAAALLYPSASPATRNRQVYSPVSAILKRSGVAFSLQRPKGSGGRVISDWLRPEQAERLLEAARRRDPEFGLFLRFLLYTGCRLREATELLHCENVDLQDGSAFVPTTKTGKPRRIHLPAHLVAELANHPRGLDRSGPVFRFHKGSRLYDLLRSVAARVDVRIPERSAFHLFRHTYATWLRRYAGADAKALVGTGAWESEKSASRYAHTVIAEDARLSDQLPVGGAVPPLTKKRALR